MQTIAFAGACLIAAAAFAQPRTVYLDTLDLSTVLQDWGAARANRSVDDHPLSIGGHGFERGIGTHANSEFSVDVGGAATRFHAAVGIDDEPCGGDGTVVFVVMADDRELVRTPVIRRGEAARDLDLDVKGAKTLTLVVEAATDSINYDHADWADATVTMADGSGVKPRALRSTQTEMAIAPAGAAGEPRLNFPRFTGGSPGKPFLFRVPASGEGPLSFEAQGLPEGLTLDAGTGIVSGSLKREGRTTARITVSGPRAKTTQEFTFVCGKDAIGLTPPMGWNSWNCWAGAVDDAKIRAAADRFVSAGLAAHGYQYVNIDDTWEGERDGEGRIRSNEKFPDMRALAEYVHGHGLKLGIYSGPGPKTCAGFVASYQHEVLDAQQYAAWGVDYLKYDWCSYGDIAPHPDHEALVKPYAVMRDALRAQDRDIFYSLCQYGMGKVWEWGAQVDGNCWRTTGDISDSWSSMAGIGFSQTVQAPFAGPGHWNDPDMLVVGKVGWGPSLHPTRLTHNEQITHITLWSMLAAPLLIGCDLTQMDDFTMAVLTNDEVIAIDQDPLGKQATRVAQRGQTEVWARSLADGTTAVALFNRSRGDAEVWVTPAELGLSGRAEVRDAWMRRDLGALGERLAAKVPSHAAALYFVRGRRD